MSSATVTGRQLILVEQWTCFWAPAVTIGEFRQAPLCMQEVLYKKYKLAMQVKSCRVTVTKGACENLAYATRWKITDGSLHFSTTTLHPFRDYPTKKKGTNKEKNASDRKFSPRLELDATAQEWTKTKSGQRERQGRESPECRAMFSRNVPPPVRSCNLTGNSPESCLTQTERVGEKWRK